MDNRIERARLFHSLHRRGEPLVLFNVWDPGSAKAVADAGAAAVATGSWSVAAAHGFGDGELLPLDLVLANAARIVAAVDVPVSVDFEGGYAGDDAGLKENILALLATGTVGINFEDGVVGGAGLYPPPAQSARIAVIRAAADGAGVPLFINARTDLFLQAEPQHHARRLDEAIDRATAYAESGADCLFVPGLRDEQLIETVCRRSPLPVNVMVPPAPPASVAARLGVARVSYGPEPFRIAMECLADAAAEAMGRRASGRAAGVRNR